MRQDELIAVYLVTGFLEAGKTTVIGNMLNNPRFVRDNRIMILSCEEGEMELDEEVLKKTGAVVVSLEDPEELNEKTLLDLNKKYRPTRVFIEYNSVWGIERLGQTALPPRWELVQVVNMCDATTFDNYMTNMRKILTDPIREADLVMVNRCAPQHNKSAWRKQLRAINPRANILFENLDHSIEDGVTDEDLPYDMKAEVIEVAEEHLGTFYLDSLDHPERYDGKVVRFTGQYFKERGLPRGYSLFGRLAMTCCADDVAPAGWLCRRKKAYGTNVFVSLTARCQMMGEGREAELVLEEVESECGETPREEFMIFN